LSALLRFSKSGVNLSINPHLSSLSRQKFSPYGCDRAAFGVHRPGLFSLLSHFFFEIFAVQNIPFATSRWYLTREGHDLSADYLIDIVFSLKELVDDAFSLGQGASLMGEIRQVFLSETIDDEMGQMGDTTF
jgi:hypothetical protein